MESKPGRDPASGDSESAALPSPANAPTSRTTPTAPGPRAPQAPPPPESRGGRPPDRRRNAAAWRTQDVLRAAAAVIAMYVFLRLIWFAQVLVLISFLGILFGLAVTAGVDVLQRFRIPRGLAAGLVTFGSIGIIVGFFALTAPTLREQSRELRTKLPESIDKIDRWIERRRGGLIGALFGREPLATPPPVDSVARARTAGPTPAGATDTLPATARTESPARGRSASDSAPTAADTTLRERILSQVSGARSFFFGFMRSTVSVFSGLVIVIFLSIYVAIDPQLYHDGLMHLFPRQSRKRAGEVLTAIATSLRRWLVTQLLAMIVIGVITTIVLLALRVKAAFPLGVLAGLLEFIPTIGPILSAIPAVAMGFVDSPEKALAVALAYIGIQFLENHILIPILMKEGVDLPPAVTIIAQALMALVFGFLGLLVAVPMLAAVMVAVKMLYVEDVIGDEVEIFENGED